VPFSEPYSAVFNWSGYAGTVYIETDAIITSYELYVNGDAYAAIDWISSDLSLKDDIAPIESGLSIVERLRPVSFSWRANMDAEVSNENSLGFIAQELEQVLPELVSIANNTTGLKAINYNGIIPVNTAAIQQLNEKVMKLETENEELKARLDALEKK